MPINYVPTIWVDGEDGGTPIDADRLNNMEDGIKAACDELDLGGNSHFVEELNTPTNPTGTSDADRGTITWWTDDDTTQAGFYFKTGEDPGVYGLYVDGTDDNDDRWLEFVVAPTNVKSWLYTYIQDDTNFRETYMEGFAHADGTAQAWWQFDAGASPDGSDPYTDVRFRTIDSMGANLGTFQWTADSGGAQLALTSAGDPTRPLLLVGSVFDVAPNGDMRGTTPSTGDVVTWTGTDYKPQTLSLAVGASRSELPVATETGITGGVSGTPSLSLIVDPGDVVLDTVGSANDSFTVVEAGVYAVRFSVNLYVEDPSETFFSWTVNLQEIHGYIAPLPQEQRHFRSGTANEYDVVVMLDFTAYLQAGSTVIPGISAETTGGATWAYQTGRFEVNRLTLA